MKQRLIGALVTLGLIVTFGARAQDTRPRFDVTSVKANHSGCAQGRGGGGPQPGRLSVKCMAVQDMIQAAYGTFAHGPNPDNRQLRIVDAPNWIREDLFDVEGVPPGNATLDRMYGPMLQGLLEERFQLKVRRETRDVPVYALSVASGGPKLKPAKEGSCVQIDLSHPPPQPAPGEAPPAFCGRASIRGDKEKMTVDSFGVTLSNFASLTLSARVGLDRPVIDHTAVTGMYDIHLEFAQPNGAGDSTAPAIFTAIQDQLGLRLSASTVPADVLVIEHIEKPAEN